MFTLCCSFTFYGLLVVGFLLLLRFLLEKLTIGDLSNRPVFITGCDSGFGFDLALKLLRQNVPVFSGTYTQKGEDELRKAARYLPGKLVTVQLDVTNQQSVDKAANHVESQLNGKGLWALVNNAGILGTNGVDEWLCVEDYRQSIDVNALGVIRVTHAFRPLVKKCKGRIVTTASIAGRMPFLGAGPYVVSKFAVNAYADVLRVEMAQWGVSCHTLEPGFFSTDLFNVERIKDRIRMVWNRCSSEVKEAYGEELYLYGLNNFKKMSVDRASKRTYLVIDAYYHALTARFPRKRYHPGYDATFLLVPMSMLPTCLMDFFIDLFLVKPLGVPKPAALQ